METVEDTNSGALTGRQRRYLRGLANPRKALIQVGEAGVSEAVIRALRDALESHELVKVKLQQPQDKKTDAALLAEQTGAQLCGLVGHTVILFRAHPENPKIELPAPGSTP
ncbi:MAG: YhbY family RNA-binding protein [Myxococcota bacterium]|jgi:RNA-binding protein|nr:YhbY family RNA-binding protein [Myxococcota bacterium]